jgi:general secretion pathway protein K
MTWPGKKRGSALLSVLVVLSLAAVMAVGVAHRQAADVGQGAQFARAVQAWHVALGAENYVRQQWLDGVAVTAGPLGFSEWPEEMGVALEIDDVQARFNLNSLAQSRKGPSQFFIALLERSGVERAAAEQVAAKLREQAKQAEAQLSREAADASLQQPSPEGLGACSGVVFMADASQLLAYGLSPQHYAAIAPHVIALPDTCVTVGKATAERLVRTAADQRNESDKALHALMSDSETQVEERYSALVITVTQAENRYRLRSLILRGMSRNYSPLVEVIGRSWEN